MSEDEVNNVNFSFSVPGQERIITGVEELYDSVEKLRDQVELQTDLSDVDWSGKGELIEALTEAMMTVERVPTNGHNDHYDYDYVLDEDVMDEVRPALAENGIAVFPSPKDRTRDKRSTSKGGTTYLYIYRFELAIVHQSGQAVTVEFDGVAQDSGDKFYQQALTAGLKYTTMKLLLISSGDVDTDSGAYENPKSGNKSKNGNGGGGGGKSNNSGGVKKNQSKPLTDDTRSEIWAVANDIAELRNSDPDMDVEASDYVDEAKEKSDVESIGEESDATERDGQNVLTKLNGWQKKARKDFGKKVAEEMVDEFLDKEIDWGKKHDGKTVREVLVDEGDVDYIAEYTRGNYDEQYIQEIALNARECKRRVLDDEPELNEPEVDPNDDDIPF